MSKKGLAVLEFGREADLTIEFLVERNGNISINACDPWAGDSETGFGREVTFPLSRAEAAELRDWLTAKLEEESA